MFRLETIGTLCVLYFCLSTGCDVINPEETVPTYIEISNYEIDVEDGQGTADQRLSTFWIFIDDNFQGVYPPSSQIPLLIEEEGEHQLIVGPGVEINGISSNNSEYFALSRDTFTISKSPGNVRQIEPVFSYRSETTFPFIEDFEQNVQLALDVDADDTTNLRTIMDTVFEGEKAGELFVDTANRIMQVASLDSYVFPQDGSPVYIELNYKNNVEFQVGLLALDPATGQTIPVYKTRLRTRDEWNKVYLDLTSEVLQVNTDRFRFLIGTGLPNNSERNSGSVYVDNIKLLAR